MKREKSCLWDLHQPACNNLILQGTDQMPPVWATAWGEPGTFRYHRIMLRQWPYCTAYCSSQSGCLPTPPSVSDFIYNIMEYQRYILQNWVKFLLNCPWCYKEYYGISAIYLTILGEISIKLSSLFVYLLHLSYIF